MKKYLLISVVCCLLSPSIFAQKAAKLDSLFSHLHQEGRFNGNVLIAEKGIPVFQKSYGYADEANQQKLDQNTVFDLASVSKEFTATAIRLLEKRGKLKTEDPIADYIPELDFYKGVKIRHLIHHTSGLPDFMVVLGKQWNPENTAFNIDFVNLFNELRPEMESEPGEKFSYSNTGYALLGLIIERVSEKTYGEFLKENIFDPLEMNDTRVYRHFYDDQIFTDYALGYISDSTGGKIAVDDLPHTNFRHYLDGIVGAGQIKSTTDDLLKWDRALYKDDLFDKEDKELFFSPVQLNDGKSLFYGFGWVLKNTENYGKIIYHPGRWAGYVNHFERDLENDKTIIILQNNDLERTITPKNRVRDILYGTQPVQLPEEILKSYTGTYKNKNRSFEIRFEDRKLYYVNASGNEFEMRADSEKQFIASQYLFDAHFTFEKDKNGGITCHFSLPETELYEEVIRE